MITVEDKIKAFFKYVYDKELKISKDKLNEIENNNQECLNEFMSKLEKKKLNIFNGMDKRISLDSNKLISNGNIKANNKLLATRNELLNNLINEIIKHVTDFVDSEEYKNYFLKLRDYVYDNFSSDDNIIVYLTEKDKLRFENNFLDRFNNYKIVELDDTYIGGIIIQSPIKKHRLDMTLKSKIEENRKEIGIKLFELLEE